MKIDCSVSISSSLCQCWWKPSVACCLQMPWFTVFCGAIWKLPRTFPLCWQIISDGTLSRLQLALTYQMCSVGFIFRYDLMAWVVFLTTFQL